MQKLEVQGPIIEICQPKFLQDGAEVQTIVIEDTFSEGTYSKVCQLPIGFYSKAGLDKLHKHNLGVGDIISVPVLITGKKNREFWNVSMNGDLFKLEVVERAAKSASIDF